LTAQPKGLSILLFPLLAAFPVRFLRVVLWLQVALDTAVILSLLQFVSALFRDKRQFWPRLLASLVVVVQPFTAIMVSSVYTEQIAEFFTFFGILFLCRFLLSRKLVSMALGCLLLSGASILRIDLLAMNVAILGLAGLWDLARHTTRKNFLNWAVAGFCLVSLPLGMVGLQAYSTGELGLVRNEFPYSGYNAWMRTWFASEKRQYEVLGWGVGQSNWAAFEIKNFPPRAFDSETERKRVAALLSAWRATDYSKEIDQGFANLAANKETEHWLRNFFAIPLLRMVCYWVNTDGAQTFLRIVPIARPFSILYAGCVTALRFALIVLAAVGTYAVWFQQARSPLAISTLGRLASAMLFLRTAELGILGSLVSAGLMEARYVIVVTPFFLFLGIVGIHFISVTKTAKRCAAARSRS
jgi:hypothetical protein